MNRLSLYITLLGALLFFSGCNDEWKDELYTQMVSLKAPIGNDNVNVIYLRYHPQGEVIYKLPVVVSGSKTNGRDYDVRIDVDNDTLPILNREIYSDRADLYYHQLPASFYEFPSSTCHIPSGTNVELFDVKFKFSGLDLVEKWVLPLTIMLDPSYTMNVYKGRQKALLWVRPFNDYSGSYSATSLYVYFGSNTTSYMTANTRTMQVVDENTVFFYAGITEELTEKRGEYKVKCKFNDPYEVIELVDNSTGEKNGLLEKRGLLELSAENPLIGFEVIGTPSYRITEEFDIDRPYIVKRNFTLTMEYKYQDYTSSESMLFPYRCTGTMTMQRNVNTLIPDEDQAILW
ncbi:MAG: DUF4973 domain-containing protein [Bacteroidales bacterium]|jgi:hypothetical protein|nr:DUF4973 domain-containing protein [Bacteroidales bacterium]